MVGFDQFDGTLPEIGLARIADSLYVNNLAVTAPTQVS
jgi:hypothetical protein